MAKTSAAKSQSIYGVHPSVAMAQKSLAELKDKTGRSLEDWIVLVKKEVPRGEKEQREWLKTKHKLGMNVASWIAERADGDGGDFDSPETYLRAAVGYVECIHRQREAFAEFFADGEVERCVTRKMKWRAIT